MRWVSQAITGTIRLVCGIVHFSQQRYEYAVEEGAMPWSDYWEGLVDLGVSPPRDSLSSLWGDLSMPGWQLHLIPHGGSALAEPSWSDSLGLKLRSNGTIWDRAYFPFPGAGECMNAKTAKPKNKGRQILA